MKILIVDDHPSVREGLALRISLHADLTVCGEAETEDQALALVKQFGPDLVLVDISLKSGHGIELIKRKRLCHICNTSSCSSCVDVTRRSSIYRQHNIDDPA